MIKINDYATKNHLNEWEIKELPKSNVYRLDLTDNNFELLLLAHYEHFEDNHKVFLPNISKQQLLILQTYITGQDELNRQQYGSPQNATQYYVLCDKTELICDNFHYITPDWSKYIAKDNAVLFLSDEDADRYSNSYDDVNLVTYKNAVYHLEDENVFKRSGKTSIILPSIHSQNIQEISNITNDLKENYGVEYVEIVTLDCYLKNLYTEYRIRFYRNIDFKKYRDVNTDISIIMKNIENDLDGYLYIYNFTEAEETLSNYEEFQKDNLESMSQKQDIAMTYKEDFSIIPNDTKVIIMNDIKESLIEFINDNKNEYKQIKEYFNISSQISFYDKKNIDKIITTDSTGVLEVQDTKHLQVIDCQEFFNN